MIVYSETKSEEEAHGNQLERSDAYEVVRPLVHDPRVVKAATYCGWNLLESIEYRWVAMVMTGQVRRCDT